jgi:radical SAM superfamily enzyme YgiQ (UPF0313 family)
MRAAPTGVRPMRVLLIHPSPLMYSEIYLRLEPLGLERVAQAVRMAGHDVRIVDLQTFSHRELHDEIDSFRPQAMGFSLNYLANVPEVIDLAKEIKAKLPLSFVFVGGHSGSFIAEELLEHSNTAIDCVLRGEGEIATPLLLAAIAEGGVTDVPGAVTLRGSGPAPGSNSPAVVPGIAPSAAPGPSMAAATAPHRPNASARNWLRSRSPTSSSSMTSPSSIPSTASPSARRWRSGGSRSGSTSRPGPTCC